MSKEKIMGENTRWWQAVCHSHLMKMTASIGWFAVELSYLCDAKSKTGNRA